mmetsp:Transcript_8043/g.20556  ORF Transcript_8043/g.20556 Transcript_8043/m.20556 type:complete len:237 (+) Transcript_8043:169-879(+)
MSCMNSSLGSQKSRTVIVAAWKSVLAFSPDATLATTAFIAAFKAAGSLNSARAERQFESSLSFFRVFSNLLPSSIFGAPTIRITTCMVPPSISGGFMNVVYGAASSAKMASTSSERESSLLATAGASAGTTSSSVTAVLGAPPSVGFSDAAAAVSSVGAPASTSAAAVGATGSTGAAAGAEAAAAAAGSGCCGFPNVWLSSVSPSSHVARQSSLSSVSDVWYNMSPLASCCATKSL